uniref:hypothetical protein n=1 Tax=Bartonella heixiaziensis TaxID=1461000 RepID=UPI003908A96F
MAKTGLKNEYANANVQRVLSLIKLNIIWFMVMLLSLASCSLFKPVQTLNSINIIDIILYSSQNHHKDKKRCALISPCSSQNIQTTIAIPTDAIAKLNYFGRNFLLIGSLKEVGSTKVTRHWPKLSFKESKIAS